MIGIATGSPPAAALARRPVTLLLATGRVAVLLAFEKAAWTAGLTLVASPDGLHAIMSALRRPPTGATSKPPSAPRPSSRPSNAAPAPATRG